MRIPLISASYEARSIISSAQRQINLFPERNPQDAPVPFTHYITPGLSLLVAGTGAPVRCTYRASTGALYMVVGGSVYYVNSSFSTTLLGTINYGTTPVSMVDNGLAIIIVDGSANGWAIDLATNNFGTIPYVAGGPFFGSPRVDYLDTFFLLSVPGTNEWYISLSDSTFTMLTSVYGSIDSGTTVGGSGYTDGTYTGQPLLGGSGAGATGTFTITGGVVGTVAIDAPGAGYVVGDTLTASGIGAGTNFAFQVVTIGGAFDPLNIATKNGFPDPIVGVICMHREIWLVGTQTTEIWYNTGGATFPFTAMQGAFVQHGAISPYTLCTQDLSVYWLSLDPQGRAIFNRGAAYQVVRISTHAIENEWATYNTVTDAISFIYQQEGHVFVFVVFPSANKTWVYDQTPELWHERAWTDNNGNLNRHRANCVANAYGYNVVGDFQNGNLLYFNENNFTDWVDGNGLNSDGSYPMSFIKAFPHEVADGNRRSCERFAADFQVGYDTGSLDGTSSASGAITSATLVGGSGYTNGTYTNTSLAGGNGVNAAGTAVVSGGVVASLSLTYPGMQYQIGDILTSTSMGSGSGFTYTVNNVSIAPTISLRWSDDRGQSYGNKVEQSMGAAGQYLTQPQWRRTGMARDRVFELSWSTPTFSALNGSWIDVTEART